MAESPLLVLCLGTIALCLIAMTVAMGIMAWELRLTLRDARRLLWRLRRLLAGVLKTTRTAETILERLCHAAADALEGVTTAGNRIRALFTGHVGNGAGADPRWRHRRG